MRAAIGSRITGNGPPRPRNRGSVCVRQGGSEAARQQGEETGGLCVRGSEARRPVCARQQGLSTVARCCVTGKEVVEGDWDDTCCTGS